MCRIDTPEQYKRFFPEIKDYLERRGFACLDVNEALEQLYSEIEEFPNLLTMNEVHKIFGIDRRLISRAMKSELIDQVRIGTHNQMAFIPVNTAFKKFLSSLEIGRNDFLRLLRDWEEQFHARPLFRFTIEYDKKREKHYKKYKV
jgi:hypothetical protein